jgi:alpha-1,3-rhamnosyltransferase
MNKQPLISIVVITYNSSKFVFETLESIKAQTYKNIELIISDDASTDNTIEVCENWLKKNNERFVETKLVTSEVNTGIAPNCNRGLSAAKGEWVKYIAGDDILLDNCISDFVNFTKINPDCKVVFGKILILNGKKIIDPGVPKFFKQSKAKQKEMVYTGSSIPAPSNFISRELLLKIGGFDERFPFIEDVPLWIKIASYDQYFYLLDKPVVIYRSHPDSITALNNRKKSRNNFIEDEIKLMSNIILPYLKKNKKYLKILHLKKMILFKTFINKYYMPPFLIKKIKYIISPSILFYKIVKFIKNFRQIIFER